MQQKLDLRDSTWWWSTQTAETGCRRKMNV